MRKLAFILALVNGMQVYGQDDLLDMLESEAAPTADIVTSTFKGTRIINGHSVELRAKGTLDFLISHRFGTINSGAYNFWGLDQSNVRMALEYAFSDQMTIGLGRSSYEKTFDGFVKYRLLQQQSGKRHIPVTAVLFASVAYETLRRFDDYVPVFSDKLTYTYQLLVARKMSPKLSLQLSPTLVYYNLIEVDETTNAVLSLGTGGRYKLSSRVTLNAEYFYQLRGKSDRFNDAVAIGVDIETGGHVFQLQFTNATAMIEKGFVGESFNDFFAGDIHFGFNIARTFQLK